MYLYSSLINIPFVLVVNSIVYYALHIRSQIKFRIRPKWSYSIVQLQAINYPEIINIKHNINALKDKGYKITEDKTIYWAPTIEKELH